MKTILCSEQLRLKMLLFPTKYIDYVRLVGQLRFGAGLVSWVTLFNTTLASEATAMYGCNEQQPEVRN